MRFCAGKKGFTLLEVMVASVIGSFVALVAVGALRTVIVGKETVNGNIAAADELRFAAESIRSDLSNLYRDKDARSRKLVGAIEGSGFSAVTSVTMRITSSAKARVESIEGDVYEVQYFLQLDDERSALAKRLCPITGVEEEDETMGGILTVIAENIVGFDVQYYDGQEWLTEWLAEDGSLPELVEVSLSAMPEGQTDENKMMRKVFTINFPRMPQASPEQNSSEQNSQGNESGNSGR